MIADVTQNYDCVFWSGDLNFRLTPPREEVMSWINKQKFPLTSPSLGCLADQLTTSIVDGESVLPAVMRYGPLFLLIPLHWF